MRRPQQFSNRSIRHFGARLTDNSHRWPSACAASRSPSRTPAPLACNYSCRAAASVQCAGMQCKPFRSTHSYMALRRFCTSCIWSIARSVSRFASLPCESTLTSCRMTLYSPGGIPALAPDCVACAHLRHLAGKRLPLKGHQSNRNAPARSGFARHLADCSRPLSSMSKSSRSDTR